MSRQRIAKRLVQYGKDLYDLPGSYTSNRAADRFVRSNSNAWLFGVIFDQGIPYERAWEAPYILKQRLGHLNMKRLAKAQLTQGGDERGSGVFSSRMVHRFLPE
jgi:hypothetical protein